MKGITGNDKTGLANRWFRVPEEIKRPESAIKFDQKGGVARDKDIATQAMYWRSRQERNAQRSQRRKDANKTDG